MPRNRQAGFTLVEAMVVTVVLGIVTSVVIVGTTKMVRSSKLVGAVNTLVADLRHTRTLATTEGRSFLILFSSSGYSVCRSTPSQVVLQRTCPSGVTCAATDTATFFAWGLTAPVTVTLTASGSSKVVQLAANGNITR